MKSFDGYLTEAFTRQHYVQIAKVLNQEAVTKGK